MVAMKPASQTRILAVARLLLGIGLLAALVLWQHNARKLVELLFGFQTEYLVALVVIHILLRWVSALKWGVLLRDQGINLPILRLFSLNLIGQFFSNFMPSMIGGDVTKIYLLGRQIKSQVRSAASVFMDRFTGLIGLVFLVLTFSLINYRLVFEPMIGLSVGLIALGCAVLVTVLYYGRWLSARTARFEALPGAGKIVRLLRSFYDELASYQGRYKALSMAFLWSLVFYFLTSLSMYFSCVAIGFRPAFIDVALVTPIIFLVTAIPVSPNNLGWWEWCVSLLLGGSGASVAEGLMVALTLRAVSTSLSFIGGVLFLMERVDRRL